MSQADSALHSKMIMYVTSTMTSPVTKTAKTSKWLRLQIAKVLLNSCHAFTKKTLELIKLN